ncbi:hypothetical protein [Methylomonas fluvii]|nr:hypothetical protein [Methylomonas fluvii]
MTFQRYAMRTINLRPIKSRQLTNDQEAEAGRLQSHIH